MPMDEGNGFDMAACLARVRQRDETAARELVAQLYPLVIKIVRAHRAPRLEEEDMAQEIFAKIFDRLPQYRGVVPFEHWVSRVAVGTCLNALRALRARPEVRWADLKEEEANVLDALMQNDAPLQTEAVAARDLVDKLLATLAPEDRLILSLMDLEERSVAEISRLTGWNASLIKIRAFRARRKLRKVLQRLMHRESL